ncbi:hypothetical protein N7493_008470 [Penicillium malachiteum]|uniref:Uncharacterized protein n=1 Tax=Penicillium malachiteum TaxID=1324776 RepID=A0AAD6MTR2_9EURO|nr:hypothetical protein N7493_008470 [Penicillium malachiteum]
MRADHNGWAIIPGPKGTTKSTIKRIKDIPAYRPDAANPLFMPREPYCDRAPEGILPRAEYEALHSTPWQSGIGS